MAILGIDEVGRGPWAGPLVIGAVILNEPDEDWYDDLTDSKKLSPRRRRELAQLILDNAPATALGWVSSQELDDIGLMDALNLATRRAVTEIKRQKVPFHEIIIDGNVNFLAGSSLENYTSTVVKADLLIREVSAASIIAKVARDDYMMEIAQRYPNYGFERHMGYGTALHQQRLLQFGPCPIHRRSVKPVRNLLPPNQRPRKTNRHSSLAPSSSIGARAEQIAADHLLSLGHQIIARNHKTPFYEIDIISCQGQQLYFTEVKYRRDQSRGSSAEMITPQKLQQMRFAAESFLKFQPQLRQLSPQLAAATLSGPDFHLDAWFPIAD